jgi:UDP-N-acetylglucosamine 4,6-dehydratase (inverting)
MDLSRRTVLVTGGTGSFGQRFVRRALERYPEIRRLVVYSRDEMKQYEMSQQFPEAQYPAMRYFIGDIRDKERLRRALEDIEIVIHAAALKQVPAAEYNPFEFIKTNVLGAQNLIESCLDLSVQRVVALSTDKAAAPVNLYGVTKLASDKLFTAANNIKGRRDIRFSVVRYGNVMGSRGSVIPAFLRSRSQGVLPLITLDEGVAMVAWALQNALGGEIFVPKIPSYRITDLAKAICPECEHRVVGVRPGEKLHEEMITESDSRCTVDTGNYYAILPTAGRYSLDDYCKLMNARPVRPGFRYSSDVNSKFLTAEEIRSLIRIHVDGSI